LIRLHRIPTWRTTIALVDSGGTPSSADPAGIAGIVSRDGTMRFETWRSLSRESVARLVGTTLTADQADGTRVGWTALHSSA